VQLFFLSQANVTAIFCFVTSICRVTMCATGHLFSDNALPLIIKKLSASEDWQRRRTFSASTWRHSTGSTCASEATALRRYTNVLLLLLLLLLNAGTSTVSDRSHSLMDVYWRPHIADHTSVIHRLDARPMSPVGRHNIGMKHWSVRRQKPCDKPPHPCPSVVKEVLPCRVFCP